MYNVLYCISLPSNLQLSLKSLIAACNNFAALQYEVRLKTVGYNLLYGKKASLQLTERWIGDELGREDRNSNAAQFVQVVCASCTCTV